jgi:molecular chaperone GrpE (heat shock protein)
MLKLPLFVLLSVTSSSTQAFSFVNTKTAIRASTSSQFIAEHQQQYKSRSNTFILNAESEKAETGDEKVEEVEAELTDEEPKTTDDEEEATSEDDEEEEEKEPEEDPEITAIKKEIADLESSLKQKNRDLNNLERMAEEYTKGGYARKVAEMESFRRSKSLASADNESAARADVLQGFLPILDKLKEANKDYEGDDFAKAYSAISWDFNNGLKDLGVTDFTLQEGDKADTRRVVAIEEEYSETIAKGCVIKPVEMGFELDGNVMRLATAVVSLGPEPAEEEASEDDEAEEGDDAEGEAKAEE